MSWMWERRNNEVGYKERERQIDLLRIVSNALIRKAS